MSFSVRRISSWVFWLSGALFSASCSTPLCELGSYDRGVGECPADRYSVTISLDSDRTDLRMAPTSLAVRVKATTTDTNVSFDLISVQSTELAVNSAAYVQVPTTVGADHRSVIATIAPEVLQPGTLQAQVTLAGLPAAQTTKPHRVFRSPKLGAAEMVMGTTSPNYSGTVTGRVAVQIASPFGTAGQMLITDEVDFLGTRRWLDLYAQLPNGTIGYVNSAPWKPIAVKMLEGPAAMLALIPQAIVIYDFDGVTMQRDLTLLSLSGKRQSKLSSVEPKMQLPNDAIALAASSEESAVLLAQTTEVRVFHLDPAPAALPVNYIGHIDGLAGPPVVAARDALAAKPAQGSADYFAVVWETTGKGTLLKLIKSAGVPTEIALFPVDSSVGVPGIKAAALADLDSDGLQDLIFAKKDDTLMWSPQNPDGSFTGSSSLGVSAADAVSISVGDLNNDFLPDLAVATKNKSVLIFRNQP